MRHTNKLSDLAQVHGASVQAGEIRGGIHLHGVGVVDCLRTPRQLPPISAHFGGREADLARLEDLRGHGHPGAPRLIVVSGQAGVGKTTLVLGWLGMVHGCFPDGQFFVDLRGHGPHGRVEPEEALEQLLHAWGAVDVPSGLANRVAQWRTLTSDLRAAVFVDDALHPAQVRPLIPGSADCLLVVTSRRQLPGLVRDGARSHQLDVLGQEAAVELLYRAGGGERVARERQAALSVVERCGRLPLAVCLAAGYLAVRPWESAAALAERLSEEGAVLDPLVDDEGAVRRAFDASYRLLSTKCASVYRALGLLPASAFEPAMVGAAAGIPTTEAEIALGVLVDASLVARLRCGAYRAHVLVRAHARERALVEEPWRESLLDRFLGWCLAMATEADRIVTPSHHASRACAHSLPSVSGFADEGQAVRWLDRRQDVLMEAVRLAGATGRYRVCWQLVDALHPLFARLRPALIWVEAHEIGRDAAERDGDTFGQVRMLTSGGAALRNAGLHEETAEWYGAAYTLACQRNDRRQQAQALQGLGNTYLWLGEYAAATERLRDALALREASGDRRGAALSQVSLAEVAIETREYTRAMALLAAARVRLAEVRDAYDAARALALLGRATGLGGDRRAGERRLRRALREFGATGAAPWQARVWELLGEVAQHHGAPAEAAARYERSRDLYESVSARDTERLSGRLRSL
ncbi:tetratricopeptide repeat protein [Streptomyces sedi]|uniref:ATP-binding protein n=1 Tax=Streptomyces sedi TaxID=555059 RepID=A0A5C4VFC4_9ACTN|nr:tetratricopeptide repeat protein [Streptomyces sedi]TNM34472.1 ATP-binding protein [Streptomyces sedi]